MYAARIRLPFKVQFLVNTIVTNYLFRRNASFCFFLHCQRVWWLPNFIYEPWSKFLTSHFRNCGSYSGQISRFSMTNVRKLLLLQYALINFLFRWHCVFINSSLASVQVRKILMRKMISVNFAWMKIIKTNFSVDISLV